MRREDFIHSSARTRVLEKKLISREMFERLIEADGLEGAYKVLSETVYGPLINKLSDRTDFEQVLEEQILATKEMLNEMSPEKGLTELLSTQEYYSDVKVLLKEYFSGEDLEDLYFDKDHEEIREWREILKRDDAQELQLLPEMIKQTMQMYQAQEDPQVIDYLIDKEYFKNLLEKAEGLGEDVFKEYVQRKIDFTNLNILLRAAEQEAAYQDVAPMLIDGGTVSMDKLKGLYMLPADQLFDALRNTSLDSVIELLKTEYAKTQSISDVEKVFDNNIMQGLKEGAKVTYGPEVLFAFLAYKEREVNNLRIILTSKRSGVDKEKIRERVRDVYV